MIDKYNEDSARKNPEKGTTELDEIIYYQTYLLENKNIEEVIYEIKQHLLPSQSRHQIFS